MNSDLNNPVPIRLSFRLMAALAVRIHNCKSTFSGMLALGRRRSR
jgi:hypothetical protein